MPTLACRTFCTCNKSRDGPLACQQQCLGLHHLTVRQRRQPRHHIQSNTLPVDIARGPAVLTGITPAQSPRNFNDAPPSKADARFRSLTWNLRNRRRKGAPTSRPDQSVEPLVKRLTWSEDETVHPRHLLPTVARRELQDATRVEVQHLLAEDKFEDHDCPICGGSDYELIADTERLGLYFPTSFCTRCGLMQAQPRPTQDFYNKFYERYYRRLYEGQETIPDERAFRSRASRRPANFVNWVLNQPIFHEQIAAETDLILEIGCSAGMVVSRFADAGYRAIGVDLDPTFMELGRSLGYDLRLGKLAEVELPEAPAMIFYHHVIEHITDINAELATCAELLPDGGLLVLAVPGLNYIDKVYRSDLREYLQIAHVYNFTLASLSALVMNHGFRLVAGNETIRAIYQKGSPMDPTALFDVERLSARWRVQRLEAGRRELVALVDD